MRGALCDARSQSAVVDYVNAHGTATPQNDLVRMAGAVATFHEQRSKLAAQIERIVNPADNVVALRG